MTRPRSLLLLLTTAVWLTAAAAHAQSEGFALNRYNPAERGSDWFANESLDLRGHLRPAVGIVGDWSYKPLVLYAPGGEDELGAIVEHQLFAHVGGAVVLWDRLRGGLSVPLLLYSAGEELTTTTATFASEEGSAFGDLRLSADARLFGVYTDPWTMALGVQVHLPTGNQDAYAGDGRVRLQPRVLGAGNSGPLAYAAQLSFNYRAHSGELDGAPFGSELTFTAAAGIRLLEQKLLLGPELYGSTVVSEGDAAFDRRTTPVEVILGGKYRIDEAWRVGAGVGPGLTRGFGSPKLRVLLALEFFPEPRRQVAPPPEPKDRDGDGILDDADACPDEPGVASDEPERHGCPLPEDRDGDGILDADDACPDEPGVASADPHRHGCPAAEDRDGDGIFDEEDACPDEPGVASADPQKQGCPVAEDTDGDGILDDEDACPKDAGEPNSDPKKHGCPKAIVTAEKIEILERVEFETASATLRPESEEVLDAVWKVLGQHSELTKIRVEGHTDSRGNDAYNKALSRRRAASVVTWLTERGVERSRLVPEGYGEEQPIDSNETDEGRQNNRRVEFRILEVDGKPIEASQRYEKRPSE
jgi:OOP family OmpA-OmpF porin